MTDDQQKINFKQKRKQTDFEVTYEVKKIKDVEMEVKIDFEGLKF